MRTDLTREQILSIVDHARQQRSIAAGEVSARVIHNTLTRLAMLLDRALHWLLMSPTARQ